MDKENYQKVAKFCAKGKCKPRENSYGVVWCVRCGKLHGYNTPAEPLKEEDKWFKIMLVRGWGYLIGTGGLNLSAEEAAKIQDDFGNWIVETLSKKKE